MKYFASIFVFLFFSFSLFSQSQSVIFSRIIRNTEDTVRCEVLIWKSIGDGTFLIREKKFYNETAFSLDKGDYILQYFVEDTVLFTDMLHLTNDGSTAIMNILIEPEALTVFDFTKAIYADPLFHSLVNRKDIYIEF